MDKTVKKLSHTIYGDIMLFEDDLISNIVSDGKTIWEQSIYDAIMDHYVPGTDIIDMGANMGLSSLYMHRKRPIDGVFHLFEPQPDVFTLLYHNTRDIPRKLYNMTLGAPGSHTFAFRRSLAIQNVGGTPICTYPSHDANDIYVSTIALDDIEFERRVSIVKMDVESAEYDVILGAIKFFRKHKPILEIELLTEEHFLNVSHLLASIGYRVTARLALNDYVFLPPGVGGTEFPLDPPSSN
jgi:FkbM family methyltransferase